MHLRKKYKIKKLDIFILICILIIICTERIYSVICKSFYPILVDYAGRETEKITTMIINRSIENSILELPSNNKYFNLIMNDANEIINVDFDTVKINETLVSLTKSIENDLSLFEKGNYNLLDFEQLDKNIMVKNNSKSIVFFLPLGIASRNSILSDLGPKIPVKLSLIGSVNTEVRTEIKSYGINNALIQSTIEININIQVIMPFMSKEINVTNSVPLITHVVNGRIPDVYGGDFVATSPLVNYET